MENTTSSVELDPPKIHIGNTKILFTSSLYPYQLCQRHLSSDASGARFTRADGIFTIVSHSHHFANHLLAQNINVPSIILEYPRWDDFTKEIRKGYPIIGITLFLFILKVF